ncbi:uncharacterized protein LOC132612330 [Lycium barbarum]|uniref:uncharacterized protein LOC132612330 n=1 Tax=Lycium barbarum TaxID=112863 RepID=UPI00293F1C51|nr:uncharacterized protein LOC132612330 [Lycium barbarum]
MANFEHNVMVALYWGGEIITEMNGFRYTEDAKMIVSMFISTNYAELVELLHEKMGTDSENMQIDISGKYPCSFQDNNTRFIEFKIENDQSLLQFFAIPQKFMDKIDINILEIYVKTKSTNQNNVFQMSGQHGYHMNLLAQNYGFAMDSQPHFAKSIIQPSFQQLPIHNNPDFYNQSHTDVSSYSATHGFHQSFGAGPIWHGHRSFDEAKASVDLYNDGNAEIISESSEDDDPSGDDEESEIESQPDEDIGDIGDLLQNNIGVNPHNQFGHGVSETPCHDIPYFATLENEEDIFISTRESEMGCCSVWSEDTKKDLEKNMYFSSKAELKRALTIWSLRKNKEFEMVTSNKSLWVVRCRFYNLLGCLCFLRGRKVGYNLWKIGKYVDNHRYETEGLTAGHANLDTNLIASLFLNKIRENPKLLVVDVRTQVHEKFSQQVTYRKVWLGRQRAFELVYGDFKKSFSEHPKYFAAFQHFNHGTAVEWTHAESTSSLEVKTFKFVFWAFKPCIDGFQACRPIILVDGTHMYGKYDIKLLIVVGIDGNDNILPLAFAIVDRESKEAWKWFFRILSAHVIKDREDICVISDRAKGTLASLSELRRYQEPRAFHRFFLRHLKSNFQSRFPNKDLSKLTWKAATTHQIRKFEAFDVGN